MFDLYGNIELVYRGKNISYVLSCGIDLEKDNKFFMPSLIGYKDYEKNDSESVFWWDNDEYIYNILYKKVLIPWVKDKTISHAEDFAHLINDAKADLADFEPLMVLFQRAEELNFFKDTIKEDERTS